MFRGCKYSDAQACHLHVYVSLKVALASSHVTFAHENLEKVNHLLEVAVYANGTERPFSQPLP